MLSKMVVLKAFLTILLLSLFIQTAAAQPETVLKVGVFNFEPVAFIDKEGLPKGLYIDVLSHIAAKEKWKLEFIPGTLVENLVRLEKGEIDLLPTLIYNEERAKKFDFTNDFLFLDWGLVYRRKGKDISDLLDLKGKTIAVRKGSIYTEEFKKLLEQFAIKARIREMNEYTEVFLTVERGEVDAGINTKVNGLVLEGRFRNIEPTTIYFSPMKIRSAVPKGRHGSIISILDTNFATLKVDKNSFYYQSLDKWMGVYLRKTVFPSWLPWALGGLGGLLLFFLGASIVFRHKVKEKTRSLLAANQELFHSQEILRESEELLNATQHLTKVGGWVWNVEQQTMIWTDEVYRIHDFVPGEMMPGSAELITRSSECYETEDRPVILAAFQRCVEEGQPYDFDFPFTTAKGRRLWVRTTAQPVLESGRVIRVIGNIIDITERKRVEEALAKSESFLKEAQRVAHIGHWELDTAIMTPRWSEEIFHIFGLDPEKDEPSFEAHQKVTHPDDWSILNNAVTTSIAEGIPFDIEFRILRPDETIRWMQAIGYPKKDSDGRIISVFGTAQDITARKLMESALRVSLEKYRVLFESFPLGITISDKSGKIMEGNRQSEQLLGITREVHTQRRIDGKDWQIIRKDGTPMPVDEYASIRALRENRLIKNVEMGVVKDKGEITWISVTAAPIPLEGYGVAIAYGDITERKQIEKQLRHFQEMKILNLVAAGVAHEVRNPLNAILAVSEALFKDLGDNPEYQPYLDHIRTQVSRLSNLMTDLLELGRPVQLDLFQSHSLDELVKGAQALWQGAGFVTTHGLSIDLPGEAKKILIKTDPIRLQQALLNLLDNAAQNSPEGSTIDLSVQILNKKTCRIRIMDQGKGISPDYLPRVFDPFFTTRKGGTGLGLSLVKNFVGSLGGRVAIWNNDPLPGCTLVVTLPIFTGREVLIHETHHPISG